MARCMVPTLPGRGEFSDDAAMTRLVSLRRDTVNSSVMSSWFAVTIDGTARRVGGLGLVIGRGPTCDLVLDHAEVSRRHLLLQFGMRAQMLNELQPVPQSTVNTQILRAPTGSHQPRARLHACLASRSAGGHNVLDN